MITYDIADDQRRGKVYDACHQQADHIQYSVFIGELSERERIGFLARLEALVHHVDDQVLIADLGPAATSGGRGDMFSVGRPYAPPIKALVI